MRNLKIITLIIFLLPSLALAAGPQITKPGFLDGLQCVTSNDNCQLVDVAAGFNSLIKLLLGTMGAVALLYFVMGGFKWVYSQGNQQKVREGQQMMINTLFALTIAFTSYVVLNFFVNNILNVDSDYSIIGTNNTKPNNAQGECSGKEAGEACNSPEINYVCSGSEFQDQCVTECELKNLVDKEILDENNLHWACGDANSFSPTPPVWREANLCPRVIDKDCIIFWNGSPATDDHHPPIYDEELPI